MGANFVIPAITRAKNVETIMNPREDLRYLIHLYLGEDMAKVYDEVLENIEPDNNDQNYYQELKITLDQLDKLLNQKHIKKEEINKIAEDLRRIL